MDPSTSLDYATLFGGMALGGLIIAIAGAMVGLFWGFREFDRGFGLAHRDGVDRDRERTDRHIRELRDKDAELDRAWATANDRGSIISQLSAKLAALQPPPLTDEQLEACLVDEGCSCPRCGPDSEPKEIDYGDICQHPSDNVRAIQDGECLKCRTKWRLVFELVKVVEIEVDPMPGLSADAMSDVMESTG